MTRRDRSGQCCTCSKCVHFKCSLFSFSRFRTLGSYDPWSCPPCCIPASSGDPTPTSTVTSSSDSSSLYASTAQSGLSANVSLLPISRLQTCYPPSAHFVFSPSAPSPSPYAPACFSTPPASSSSLTPSGFFNGMLEVSESEALNFSTLFCLIPLTLFASRNLTLTYLPLSRFLDSLLCNPIAPTPDLVFFLLMLHSKLHHHFRQAGLIFL